METAQFKKIGIMGGTFNPIHNGHLMIAENAREQFGLEKVFFIPTGRSPHKLHQQVTDVSQRCGMISLAIQDNNAFVLNRIEADAQGISYTCLTLEKLQADYPDTEFYFILGADSLFDLEKWRNTEQILAGCCILAAYREHQQQDNFFQQIAYLKEKYKGRIYPLHTPSFAVSSMEIRNRVSRGQTIRYLVPPKVEQYIRDYRLYQEPAEL